MIKKAVKKVGKSAYKWLQEESNGKQSSGKQTSAYPWLNSICTKILAEGDDLRVNYTWGVLHSAYLAKSIGINRVSVIEFGVAGGNGLISLEKVAQKIEPILDVAIDVYGFDTGKGLPKPQDYRDLPNIYAEGDYEMDWEALKMRLKKAKLILGLVEDTVPEFIKTCPAPIAFISIDLDYYSSTLQALKILDADQSLLLPRIHCYFDDIMGFTCSDFNGERLAISEFNESHTMRKISPIYGLKYFLPREQASQIWTEMFYMAHIFNHDLYGRNDGLVKHDFRDINT